MKLLSICITLTISGCATTVSQTTVAKPATVSTVTTAEKEETQEERDIIAEQVRWEASVKHIKDVFNRDSQSYIDCVVINGSNSTACNNLLSKICERSTYIDSRSNSYRKEMCFPKKK